MVLELVLMKRSCAEPSHMIIFIFNSVFYLYTGLAHMAILFDNCGPCEWTCWSLILLFELLHTSLSCSIIIFHFYVCFSNLIKVIYLFIYFANKFMRSLVVMFRWQFTCYLSLYEVLKTYYCLYRRQPVLYMHFKIHAIQENFYLQCAVLYWTLHISI